MLQVMPPNPLLLRTGRQRSGIINVHRGPPFTNTLCGKSMALNDIERKRIEKTVSAFVEKRRPAPHIRPKLDFGFRVSGQSVELFEIRPQWNRPTVKRENPFAKATFVRTQAVWRVFWKRADLKWHTYEPVPEVAVIEDFLAVVQKDEYACFFG